MNIEQAIEIIECFFRESDNKCANRECDLANPMCQYEREAAFEIALSALREKQDHENGPASRHERNQWHGAIKNALFFEKPIDNHHHHLL